MLTFFETIRLPFKPRLNDTIENRRGQKFKCIGFGKKVIDNDYQDYYTYRQFNTEQVPVQFEIIPGKYCEAMENKLIFKI